MTIDPTPVDPEVQVYPVETITDPQLRHFFKVYRLTNQVISFTTYKEGTTANVLPQDTDHFYWVEFTQTIRNLHDAQRGIPAQLEIKAYVDGEPIGLMDDLQVGVVWEPSIKKFLPKVDFGDMSRDMFYFDHATWQWKVPLYEGGKVQVWNPMSRQYEEYQFNQQV